MIKNIFVHIGYHKTATTWIQENVFNRHPEITYLGKAQEYPVPKVIDIFHSLYEDSDVRFSVEENKKRWNAILSKLNIKNRKIFGLSDEGLSGGIDWFGGQSLFVADRIKAIFSDYNVKIIIGIREQCSMLESFYSEYVRRGGTNSLRRLIYSPFSTGRFLLDKLYYYRQIEYYFNKFGRENVFIYLFEEIKGDYAEVVTNLLRFLHLSEIKVTQIPSKKLHTRLSLPGLILLRLFNMCFFGPFNDNAYFIPISPSVRMVGSFILKFKFIKKIFPKLRLIENYSPYKLEQFLSNEMRRIPDALVDFFDRILFSRFRFFRYSLNNSVREDIVDRYRESNIYLSQIICKDLKKYGYPYT